MLNIKKIYWQYIGVFLISVYTPSVFCTTISSGTQSTDAQVVNNSNTTLTSLTVQQGASVKSAGPVVTLSSSSATSLFVTNYGTLYSTDGNPVIQALATSIEANTSTNIFNGGSIINSQSGTAIDLPTKNDVHSVVTINGGIVQGDIVKSNDATINGTATINVNSNFTSQGNFSNINNLNISSVTANNITFVLNKDIQTAASGTTIQVGSSISDIGKAQLDWRSGSMGTDNVCFLDNNGVVILKSDPSARQLNGDYVQKGVLSVEIADKNNYGRLVSNDVSLESTATFQVSLVNNGGVISDGDSFDIITGSVGLTSAIPSLTDAVSLPQTTVLSFVPVIEGNILKLKAVRKGYTNFVTTAKLEPVTAALEQARQNSSSSDMRTVLQTLESSGDSKAISKGLTTLAPEVHNGNVKASFAMQDVSFDKVTARLDAKLARVDTLSTGYSAGDCPDRKTWVGPIFFGSTGKRREGDGISDYKARSAGVGLLLDTTVSEKREGTLGGGVTFSTATVNGSNNLNKTNITSVQGLLYGSVRPQPLFVDGMLSVSRNSYYQRRNIQVGSILRTASARYPGIQYGGNIRVGTVVTKDTEVKRHAFYPFCTLRYFNLHQNGYIEQNAGDVGLSVRRRKDYLLQGGVGVNLVLGNVERDRFIPSIQAVFLQDLRRSDLKMTSQFLGGGDAFTVAQNGFSSKRQINLSANLTAKLINNFMVVVNYGIELRKKYFNQSGYVHLKYQY